MKINSTPQWNHHKKTVTLQLTDEQYDQMMQADFRGQWHLLRFTASEVKQV